jgi:hypothetical protein
LPDFRISGLPLYRILPDCRLAAWPNCRISGLPDCWIAAEVADCRITEFSGFTDYHIAEWLDCLIA